MKQKATLKLILKGADCASCAIGLEQVVKEIPGVSSAVVNPVAETITVEYDDARANPVMFADRMQKTYGFGAEVGGEEQEVYDDERMLRERELTKLRRKVIVGIVLSALIVLFAFTPILKMTIANYLLFVLATSVMVYVGGQFFSSFLRGLRHRNANMDTLVAVGTGAAYVYSTLVTFASQLFSGVEAQTYFDVGAVVITLVLLGKFFE